MKRHWIHSIKSLIAVAVVASCSVAACFASDTGIFSASTSTLPPKALPGAISTAISIPKDLRPCRRKSRPCSMPRFLMGPIFRLHRHRPTMTSFPLPRPFARKAVQPMKTILQQTAIFILPRMIRIVLLTSKDSWISHWESAQMKIPSTIPLFCSPPWNVQKCGSI